MIPVLIGAAIGAAAAYKFLDKERHDLALQEKTSTRIISEDEVPPDVLEKIKASQRKRSAKKFHC